MSTENEEYPKDPCFIDLKIILIRITLVQSLTLFILAGLIIV